MLFGGNSKRVPVGKHKKDVTPREHRNKVRQEALTQGKMLLYPEEIWMDVEEEDPSKRKLTKRDEINILLVEKLEPPSQGVYTSSHHKEFISVYK